jgi:glyoxylase-like metal-dependent hydrolase (beta-lactamase superfamily II)
MKRLFALVLLMTVGALSMAVTAAQQPAAPKVVVAEKLKDNLWILKGDGGGGNTAVFVQSNGVVVVDTKNPGWGTPILEKIKELTNKPVTTIINTHTHGDHVSGNVEFPATVDVVTHANTKTNMEKMGAPSGFPAAQGQSIFAANGNRNMSKRTFADKMTLFSGADQIDLHYFGRGHTNGDAMVVFPALRVMHMGDIFSGKNIPLLDANNGGSGVDIGETLAKVHAGVKNIDVIIPGHSTNMTMNDLKEYADFNKEFLAMVQAAKKAGKTADEVAKSWTMPAKYAGYAAPAAPRLLSNVQVIYNELK